MLDTNLTRIEQQALNWSKELCFENNWAKGYNTLSQAIHGYAWHGPAVRVLKLLDSNCTAMVQKICKEYFNIDCDIVCDD